MALFLNFDPHLLATPLFAWVDALRYTCVNVATVLLTIADIVPLICLQYLLLAQGELTVGYFLSCLIQSRLWRALTDIRSHEWVISIDPINIFLSAQSIFLECFGLPANGRARLLGDDMANIAHATDLRCVVAAFADVIVGQHLRCRSNQMLRMLIRQNTHDHHLLLTSASHPVVNQIRVNGPIVEKLGTAALLRPFSAPSHLAALRRGVWGICISRSVLMINLNFCTSLCSDHA